MMTEFQADASPIAAAPRADVDLLGTVAGPPPVDAARVRALRAAVLAGMYLSSPTLIAERMIEADLSR